MQIVLLSGGSGKRLWPLSNNSRSKQFLPLLEKEDGGMESMVQRVVRQVFEEKLTGQVTIATNASQLDIITLQLGDSVSVVTEPVRRDTFPAIALAASYLKMEKGCADDEVVVIMPCDPYTEAGYFKTIRKMAECVEMDAAQLVLMGITPTCPSTKFGYVVPQAGESDAGFRKVSRFTEKPSVEVAEQLLEEGAMWNGGVFAFRLGYMMEIVRKYVDEKDFSSTRARYCDFPKISFDYEVAEKAPSVAVVPFAGQWKDLGTWNTLAGELGRSAIGNAVIGPGCEDTHVINELQHPIYVEGISSAVVAASPDGILVCSKDRSEFIKSAVENLSPRPMYEEKCWGTYRVIDDSDYGSEGHALTKSITIFPGKETTYQVHRYRTETWTVVEGYGWYVLDGEIHPIKAGEVAHIPVGHWHALKAQTRLSMIEVQSGGNVSDEDIERDETFVWNI